MKLLVWEVLDKMNKQRSKAEKIKVLKDNETWALKDVLRGSMDSTIEWNVPAGKPPYTPCQEHNHPARFEKENQKFAFLIKGGKGDHLPAYKRENILIGMLEGINPKDAELVVDMIQKIPPKGISRPIVEEAFPGLLKDTQE
jgi:hypothetical protein